MNWIGEIMLQRYGSLLLIRTPWRTTAKPTTMAIPIISRRTADGRAITDLVKSLWTSGSISGNLVSAGASGIAGAGAGGATVAVGRGVAVDEGTASWAMTISVGVACAAVGTLVAV